jgi:signal transduction histidine kinase
VDTGAILRFNNKAHESLGYTREEFAALKMADFELTDNGEECPGPGGEPPRPGVVMPARHRTRSGDILKVHVSRRAFRHCDRVFVQNVYRDVAGCGNRDGEVSSRHEDLEELAGTRTAQLLETARQLEAEIAEHAEAEREIEELYLREKRLREELERQMSRRVEFTRGLIHELKTPLTPMLGASDLLVQKLDDAELLRMATNINRGIRNLHNRINDLMDLARGELGKLHLRRAVVDVSGLLSEVRDYLAPNAAKKQQCLSLDLPEALPTVVADEDRLRQVVLNLTGNAMKFTPQKGSIHLRALRTGDCVTVEVEDNGCGIPRKGRHRLFEPYYTLESRGEHTEGLGLGLPLSRMLIELHGGRMWIRSREGEGSIFGFSIPL